MPVRIASCACGQLRVTCEGKPELVSLCHCQACKKRTGSAFGIAAFYTADKIRQQGERTQFSRLSDESVPVHFCFCPGCGTTLYWETRRKPGWIAVAAGCFNQGDFPWPDQQVHTENRCDWLGGLNL